MERKKLIKLRGEKTRPYVAEHIGITPQMLGAIERGDRTPSLSLAKKIADYYEVSIDYIFFDDNRNKMFLEIDNVL
ncbi:helix-turn-helix transcriptional regulator [Metabacillus fastidiosus]|uniref:helix-turn-helix transcriptional regulator n=1 Tax=Metabacillus fastidiosus TaxID=1458 RepID=UPI003D2E905C